MKFIFWFLKHDLWRAFLFSVILIWLPILILGGQAVEWQNEFLVIWLLVLPLFWCAGLILRAFWFALLHRKGDSIEADYAKFVLKK